MYKFFETEFQLDLLINKLFRLHQEQEIMNNFKKAAVKKELINL